MNKFVLISCFLVVACGKRDYDPPPSAEPIKSVEPKIPYFSVSDLTKLSKNERQELERRCLGSSHKTCEKLKSEDFKNVMKLEQSFCQASNAQNRIIGGSMKNCDL